MRNLTIVFFIISFTFIQCSIVSSYDKNEKCEENNVRSSELITEFYFDNNYSHLDSALYYIDEVYKSCEDRELNILLAFRKLSIYSIKNQFSEALKFIDTFDDAIFDDLPYYKDLLINRFKAMKAQSEADTITRNIYLEKVILDIEKYLSENNEDIDKMLNLSNVEDILINPYSTAVTQLYYYRSILRGRNEIIEELDSLQKTTDWNDKFLKVIGTAINEDFMDFFGI